MACAPSWTAVTVDKEPRKEPTGVRAAERMYMGSGGGIIAERLLSGVVKWIEDVVQSRTKTKQYDELPHQDFYISGISLCTCISVPDVLAYPDSRPDIDFAKFVACPLHLHTKNIPHPDELTMDELYDVSDCMSRLRHPPTY